MTDLTFNSASPLIVGAGVPQIPLATTIIANGASLSGAVQVAGKLVGIITPTAWTAAGLSFSVSQDGTTYVDLYDAATERTVASAAMATAASRMLSLSLVDWLSVNWIKIRSGTSGSPVTQGAARTFTLILAA